MAKKQQQGIPVLVTTEHRGVFFGYLDGDHSATILKLKNARNCISWTSSVKGFLGLAVTGPDKTCRVGPAAPTLTLQGVTSVAEVTPEAVTAWEKAPW